MSHQFRKLGEAEMSVPVAKASPESFVRDFLRWYSALLIEQRTIADFLDRETARIDELITENTSPLLIYGRKKGRAMIWDLVRLGEQHLDHRSDTSIYPFLEAQDLPALEIERLKWWVSLFSGYAFDGANFRRSDEGWPVLITPGNFHPDGHLYFEEANRVVYGDEYDHSFRLRTNDLVVVMTDLSYRKLILSHAEFVPEGTYPLNQRVARVVHQAVPRWTDQSEISPIAHQHARTRTGAAVDIRGYRIPHVRRQNRELHCFCAATRRARPFDGGR